MSIRQAGDAHTDIGYRLGHHLTGERANPVQCHSSPAKRCRFAGLVFFGEPSCYAMPDEAALAHCGPGK
ncbi:hypothetical protein [Burkholderia sp. NLJ2]|uniref:hypothetical protein n=1 Tax=Burkholderia sp. NLJ2 TaxID=3090699 RepID=UPI003C6C8683